MMQFFSKKNLANIIGGNINDEYSQSLSQAIHSSQSMFSTYRSKQSPLPAMRADHACITSAPGKEFSLLILTQPENGSGSMQYMRLTEISDRIKLSFVKDENGDFLIQPSFVFS